MTANADTRLVFSDARLSWLHAVGKLQVPGQRDRNGKTTYHVENCSATLIARPQRRKANIIITAWHCLEFYRDLSKPIVFTVATASGTILSSRARRLADGGGMHADWAILQLSNAIPSQEVRPMQLHPETADPNHSILMAGYSQNQKTGNGVHTLTFDPACNILLQEPSFGTTNCAALKGASGGAVIQALSGDEPRVCGVISQGDSENVSTYVPVESFRQSLELYLR